MKHLLCIICILHISTWSSIFLQRTRLQRFSTLIAQRVFSFCWRRQLILTCFEQLWFSFVTFNSERWRWCSYGVPNCTVSGGKTDGKWAYTLLTNHSLAGNRQSHRHFRDIHSILHLNYSSNTPFVVIFSYLPNASLHSLTLPLIQIDPVITTTNNEKRP